MKKTPSRGILRSKYENFRKISRKIPATVCKFCKVAGCKPAFLQILQSIPNVFLRISRNFRSSRPEVFCKKDILKYFEKITGKHLCQSLFFNKVAGLRPPVFL